MNIQEKKDRIKELLVKIQEQQNLFLDLTRKIVRQTQVVQEVMSRESEARNELSDLECQRNNIDMVFTRAVKDLERIEQELVGREEDIRAIVDRGAIVDRDRVERIRG